jgi:hypothetical protein
VSNAFGIADRADVDRALGAEGSSLASLGPALFTVAHSTERRSAELPVNGVND